MARPIPRGMFAAGGGTGNERPTLAGRPIVPLEWLLSHPATFPWISESVSNSVGIGFVTNTAQQFDAGYAGIVVHVALLNHANIQGANSGINWAILVNKSAVFRCTRFVNNAPQVGNFFDFLDADDGFGTSWGDVRLWVEEGGLVEMTYNNNGGLSDTMGMVLRGYGWPVAVYEEWVARGWRGGK
jgi:hypothetical protein